MNAKVKSKAIEVFILIVIVLLLGYSLFGILVTGSMMALIPISFLTGLLLLLHYRSKYLSHGLRLLGMFIIMTGFGKIVLQSLVSFPDLISNPNHLYKVALIILGCFIWRIGSRGILYSN